MRAHDRRVIFSTGKDNWETPNTLFQQYNEEFQFVLDAAADQTNHKCAKWLGPFGEHEDALSVSWQPYLVQGNIWLNPPYSRGAQRRFVAKAAEEAQASEHGYGVTCLLPARTDTKLFHEYIYCQVGGFLPDVYVTFLKGRVRFVGAKHAAPFPSMVVTFL